MVVLSLYSTYESNSTSFTSNVFSVDEIHHNYPISTTSKWIWKQQHVITRWTTVFPYEKCKEDMYSNKMFVMKKVTPLLVRLIITTIHKYFGRYMRDL